MHFLNICRGDQICPCCSVNNGEKSGTQSLGLFRGHSVWTRSRAIWSGGGQALAGMCSPPGPGQVLLGTEANYGLQVNPFCTNNSQKWEEKGLWRSPSGSLFCSVRKPSCHALPSTVGHGKLFWDSDIPHLGDTGWKRIYDPSSWF